MRIAVIGGGHMGAGLGRAWAVQNEVRVGSRDPERGRRLADDIGAAWGGGYAQAAAEADAVLLSVPWWAVDETLSQLGALEGHILIDPTNPYVDATFSRLHEFPGSSGSEQIQKQVPGALVVKGWNHVYAQVIEGGPDFGGTSATVFLAGDDPKARDIVAGLAREIGYDPVDAGPLSSARYLENLAGLLVLLAYHQGMGSESAIKLLKR